MKLLRHPVRALREPFGTAGLIVACIALVAALAGGAYAAAGLNGKQKKEVKSIAKQVAGKSGAPGAQGAQGPAGANGKDGTNGTNGTAGEDGLSVAGAPIPVGSTECSSKAGGVKYTLGATSTNVCNGEKGSPWTAGGFLPAGQTLTGTWAAGRGGTGAATQNVPISFPLPLEEAPELVFVWMTEGPFATPFTGEELTELQEEGAQFGCPGIINGVPTADPGKLCVYGNFLEQLSPSGTSHGPTIRPAGESPQIYTGGSSTSAPGGSGKASGVSQAGTTLVLNCLANNCEGLGAWAVTAEE